MEIKPKNFDRTQGSGMLRQLKKYFGFDAATAVKLKNLSSFKRFFNIIRYLLFRNRYLEVVPYFPITLMVEVSTVCNLHCPGCERVLYQTDPSQGGLPKTNVSLAYLKKLRGVLPYIYSTYFVGGLGEPFLNPEFWDIHEFFKSFGVKTGYFTNASLLDEAVVTKTFKQKVDSVLVSIDSHSKQRYEAIKKGSRFDKAVEGIRLFTYYKKFYKKPSFQLGLNFIFRRDNYMDILDYLDFAKRLGVDFINASSFIVHVEEESDKSIFWLKDQLKEEIFRQALEKARHLHIRLRLPNIRPMRGLRCPHLWHGVCIFYNGDVCACPFFRTSRPFYFHVKNEKVFFEKRQYDDAILGNYLHDDFFTQIWNGPRAKQMRRNELTHDSEINPCGLCYYKYDLH